MGEFRAQGKPWAKGSRCTRTGIEGAGAPSSPAHSLLPLALARTWLAMCRIWIRLADPEASSKNRCSEIASNSEPPLQYSWMMCICQSVTPVLP